MCQLTSCWVSLERFHCTSPQYEKNTIVPPFPPPLLQPSTACQSEVAVPTHRNRDLLQTVQQLSRESILRLCGCGRERKGIVAAFAESTGAWRYARVPSGRLVCSCACTGGPHEGTPINDTLSFLVLVFSFSDSLLSEVSQKIKRAKENERGEERERGEPERAHRVIGPAHFGRASRCARTHALRVFVCSYWRSLESENPFCMARER